MATWDDRAVRVTTGLSALGIGLTAFVLTFLAQYEWAWVPLLFAVLALGLGVVQASGGNSTAQKLGLWAAGLGLVSIVILAWWFGGWMR